MEVKNLFKKAESTRHLPEGVHIQPRQPNVEALKYTPKLWFGNNSALTTFANVFSLWIPRGEIFFIRSVRHYNDRIKDPELKEMVTAFMQQETLHAKAHDAFNESFKQHGFDVDAELEFIYKTFDRIEKWVPKRIQLGMTVFFEHMTATMAASAFQNKFEAGIKDPEVHAFNLWHAAEELEHKNVAHDVLTEIGGGYLTRIFSAFFGPLIMFPAFKKSMQRMRAVYNEPLSEENKNQLRQVQASRAKRVERVKAFYKPGFHPWDQDDTHMLKKWYEKLDEAEGEAPNFTLASSV